MVVRIYGLWPIGVDRFLFENRITATAAAYSAEQARDLAVTAADKQGFKHPEMWLDPSLSCCVDVMDAGEVPNGFVTLHYTPGWGISLPRRWTEEQEPEVELATSIARDEAESDDVLPTHEGASEAEALPEMASAATVASREDGHRDIGRDARGRFIKAQGSKRRALSPGSSRKTKAVPQKRERSDVTRR
jgi:hypothetical protein